MKKIKRHDLEYFIAKFEAIPEDKWLKGRFVSKHGECKCALGYCGYRDGKTTQEGEYLLKLAWDIARINDDKYKKYENLGFGSTPKQRVVNYLQSLR